MPKATAKTKHIEHKAELIELLLTEPINPGNDKGNPVLPIYLEKPIGFAEKFSSLLYETPNVGSTSAPEFFIHSVLGSVLTLPESGLVEKLGINRVYVKHTKEHVEYVQDSEKVKGEANVVKSCFFLEKDGKKQIALRVFTNDEITGDGNLEDGYRYSNDELKEIAEKLSTSDIDNVNIDEHVFRIRTEGDPGNKSFRLHKWQTDRIEERFKAAASSQSQISNKFKEVSTQSTNLEGAFIKLSSENVEEVKGSTRDIFDRLIGVYKDNQEKFSLSNSEAAYHGFHYGALALNCKYRYGLNCYAERIVGKGRADLIFMSRTKDANGRINPKPAPIVVEFKGEGHTADEAIAQIKNKGYLYNLSIRTKAEEAVIVGIGKGGGLKVEKDDIFQSRGFIRQILEEARRFNQNSIDRIKDILKGELKNLYYSIQSNDRHYLSKLVLGQVLALNDDELAKHIFTYANQDESIGREATTFVLFNQGKAVILNIIEQSGEQRRLRGQKEFDSNKIPPIDELDIDSAVKIDVTINTGVQHKPDGFEIEGRKGKSYYQSINVEEVSGSSQDKFQGQFKKIENVKVGDLVEGLQKSSDIGKTRGEKERSEEKLRESLSPLAEALFPFMQAVERETDFRAIWQGLFINGETEDGKEIEVYTESNASPLGRMDLGLSFTQISQDDGSLTEDEPIIIELKLASSDNDAIRKLKQAEEQMDKKYTILRSFTNKKTANHLAMVFNNRAENENSLIMASMSNIDVYHTTSGSSPEKSSTKRSGSPLAGCSKRRRIRNVGVLCIDSRDEESIEEERRKEKLMKELFDTDKMRERAKNIEFYDQLFKVSQQISKGEIIDKSVEEAFVAKMKDTDLILIDPEIRDIVKEIKDNIENKEKVRNILRRSGVAEKIGKVAEGAGLAFTAFLVGKHIVNGNIEGLGYDALNLWVMPKIGKKISGKILELGTKPGSQMLKGLAPVMGRAIGNFAAFLGLAESIKARQRATDPVDIKIADLNIATNSIFIAADVPAVVTETMSDIGMEAGVIGEFAGPVGAAVSVAVIIISQFVEASLEVEKLEEQINLTDQEKHDLYWDFFLGKKIPGYIENDMEAEEVYKQYISKIIDKFDKDCYTKITISLPSILITKEEYAANAYSRVKRQIALAAGDAWALRNLDECYTKTRVVSNELDFESRTSITRQFYTSSSARNSRIIPSTVGNYNVVCGPHDNNIAVKIVSKETLASLPSGASCSSASHYSNMKLSRTVERLFLQEHMTGCYNAISYNRSNPSGPVKMLFYMSNNNAFINVTSNYTIDVIFNGKNILLDNYGVSNQGLDIKSRYYFNNQLNNCKVYKEGTNFFYIAKDNFVCNLGIEGQKNIVVTQGNFTDSENIHSIIGSHVTDRIEVFHASYVNGQGGNDVITAKNFTTIKGYFGDSIYEKSLVLLPINFDHISKITYADNRVIVYKQNDQFINVDKQALIKTADEGIDIFVTPIKVEDSTKKVTDLHIVAKVKNKTITECEDSLGDFPISAITEDVIAGELKSIGFAFLKRFFNKPYRDSANCLIIDSVLIIFISALEGRLLNHPNFKVTKQLFGKNYDVIVGDSGNHLFHADKQQHSFYWEAPNDKSHLYLFDDKDVNVVINKANGLLDFSRVKRGSRFKVGTTEGATTIDTGNVSVVLAPGYKNVKMTFDGKEYYKLLEGVRLERDYCSHSLRVNGRFSVNSTDLINHYNCFTFDSGKVFFLRLNSNLLLLSDKGILSILNYYFFYYFPNHYFYRKWDLSIKLDGRVIKPEEFRERDSNPSSFKYYKPNERGLQIYHNQPVNKNDIGLIDFKDKSILDFDMRVINNSLVLLYRNNTLTKVENWSTFQPAREMMFAFNDVVISNSKCIASICNPEDVIVEFKREKEQTQLDKELSDAVQSNSCSKVKGLVSRGANINAKDNDGNTFLHNAAWIGRLGVVKCLIVNGANINVKNNRGLTPLGVAGSNSDVKKVLEQAYLDEDLLITMRGSDVEKIKDLIAKSTYEKKDKHGAYYYAWRGNFDTVKFLVERGVNVNATDKYGCTLLHWAALKGRAEVAQFLVAKGANMNAKDILGRTPIHFATMNNHLDLVKFLTNEGANINAKDKNGKTPLDIAKEKLKEHSKNEECSDVVQCLEKLNQGRGGTVQRKRRHHHGGHSRHHLSHKPLAIDQPEIAASDGTRPSSWINDLFNWAKSSIDELLSSNTTSSISQVDGQFTRASVSNSSSTSTTLPSDGTDKKQENGGFFRDNIDYVNANLKQMRERQTPVKFKPSGGNTILEMGDHYLSQVDFNGTIMLLDLLIRKVTGQKHISTVDQSISSREAHGYALSITNGFKKVVEQAALKSDISMHRLNINSIEVQKEITKKIIDGKFDEISGVLKSHIEKACPGREVGCPGKLSSKKFDKFMVEFNNKLNVVLGQPIQQMLHNENSTLRVSDEQINSGPQSYLSNTSIQGHLTQARDLSLN